VAEEVVDIVDLSRASAARASFARLCVGPDEAIDLATCALLIAAEDLADDPEASPLRMTPYLAEIDRLAAKVMGRVAPGAPVAERLMALDQVLFDEAGYEGDTERYYHRDNALLPRVIDRRRGLPILLSILYVEVARRCDVDASGVGFPGHFLVRCEVDDGFVMLDPFHRGRFLDRDACMKLLEKTTSGAMTFTPSLLRPASSRGILARVLTNLRQVYLLEGDEPRALRAQDRLVLLAPDSAPVLRERARLFERLGALDPAVADLERCLEIAPFGRDAEEANDTLRALRSRPRRLN